ncbi:hypothetical protein Y1Q_0007413 [Alligator mississippiensis]|uniref:Uncharacterized protein n=1 Tax=Alligator mississippiensis TaxID=8496 RepID=A0A151P7W9_ALLMI|nr:hypothetical protein Y1Q_0007413 [Alligator mississippiensis]
MVEQRQKVQKTSSTISTLIPRPQMNYWGQRKSQRFRDFNLQNSPGHCLGYMLADSGCPPEGREHFPLPLGTLSGQVT